MTARGKAIERFFRYSIFISLLGAHIMILPKTLGPFIWHFLRPRRKVVALYVALAFMAGCWGPFNTLILKYMVNASHAAGAGDVSFLILPAVLLVLNFIVFDNITWRTIGYLNYKYQGVIKNTILRDTYNVVLNASHHFFENNLSGRIANQINTLQDNIERILFRISADFIRGASLLLVALVTLALVDLRFFATLLIWFIAFFAFSVIKAKQLVGLSDHHAATEAETTGAVVDSVSNVANVRMFSNTAYEAHRVKQYLSDVLAAFQDKQKFAVLLHCVQGGLIAVMLAVMMFFLIQLYGRNAITVGDFVLIMGISMDVGHMAWYTMGQVEEFNMAVGKCKQCLKRLFVPQDITDIPNAQPLDIKKGEIEFENVTFKYNDGKTLFENKSVHIHPGEKIGLVGFSGAGKSTFVNLLLRLFDVESGSIKIDGQNIADVTQASLRRAISIIPQDTSLFHRSLMENIRYGNIDAPDEAVIQAAQRAHAHAFIEALPKGYDTLVGERGIKLSGGQRQRIAIARAMLKNAPILILDEATSALDSVTEKHIQAGLHELMDGRTTIVIAHRLSTLSEMDRILVFDAGHIIESGTHDELLKQAGHYATMWRMQAGGFLPESADT